MRISDGGWSTTDTLLAEAHVIHERSKCAGGCGHYIDEAHDGAHSGGFEVQEVTCHACAVREQWQEAHSGKDSRPTPGTLTWVQKLTKRAPKKGRRG
ncbi:hypothetical protein SAMN05216184_10498 [Georgenia satyanarayanai]|uniref:Uncharacterized protein n=1 Tax=Georgenia satyanarayanai TaxID=860221 RepID=A0A2Y9AAP2_9MICO|nr:hypothetical protein [Georgenia satyanarayanai]PYG00159.1 hypothetical protein A8987_10498 [Georgenia satyanarayanai]SSA40378.1 hypothetical protein SAMN05216184_10498 [Georgenia satyanarayanai]